jgi:hypothetical protein
MSEDQVADPMDFYGNDLLHPLRQYFQAHGMRPQEHRELDRESLRVTARERVVGRGDLFSLALIGTGRVASPRRPVLRSSRKCNWTNGDRPLGDRTLPPSDRSLVYSTTFSFVAGRGEGSGGPGSGGSGTGPGGTCLGPGGGAGRPGAAG